jgi:hypothetical protein
MAGVPYTDLVKTAGVTIFSFALETDDGVIVIPSGSRIIVQRDDSMPPCSTPGEFREAREMAVRLKEKGWKVPDS